MSDEIAKKVAVLCVFLIVSLTTRYVLGPLPEDFKSRIEIFAFVVAISLIGSYLVVAKFNRK